MTLLLVDADCGFCMRAAAWLQARTNGIAITPLQQVDVQALGLEPDAVASRLHAVGEHDVAVGSAAIAQALRHGGRLLRMCAALLDAPGLRVLAQATYSLVARFRHRLPGGTDACRLPS